MAANTGAPMARLIWDAPQRVLRPEGLAQAWRLPGAGSRNAGPVCRRSGRRATPLRFANYNAGYAEVFRAGRARPGQGALRGWEARLAAPDRPSRRGRRAART